MLVKIITVVLKNTYTTDDLIDRLELMRTYYGERLFTKSQKATLKEVLHGQCDAHTLACLEEWQEGFKTAGVSPLVVYEALDSIEEDLGGIPSIVLYTPVHFTYEHTERFGNWFREHVQPNILITLRVDPRMAGGCGFVWKSVLYDRSLRYFIRKQRSDIVTMFNVYANSK